MIERNKRKIRIAFWAAATLLFLLLGISRPLLQLSESMTWTLFWVLCALTLIAWYLINQLWYLEFRKTVGALLPILTEEKDPDRYIAENEKLLVGKKAEQIKGILRMNICAAYCEKGDYSKAEEHLLALRPQKLYGIQRVAYLADLAYVYFYLDQKAEALDVMAQNKKGLSDFAQSPHLGGLIAVLQIFELLARGNVDEAKEALEKARERWPDSRCESDFLALEQKLHARESGNA